MSPVVVRVTGEHKIKFRGGPFEVAFLVVDQANLNPRFPRIRFGALESLELAQSVIELILADVSSPKRFRAQTLLGLTCNNR